MMLSDYREITEIDGQIEFLHSQLSALYELRTSLFGATEIPAPVPTGKPLPTGQNWAKLQYDNLKQNWQSHDIKIPAFKTLSPKLKKAETLFDNFQNNAETMGKFELTIVPPTSIYTPKAYQMPTGKKYAGKTWKLFAVYNRTQGIKIDDQKSFVKQKGLTLGGLHMPGLNAYEYAAFLDAHSDDLYDLNTWSMLPMELDKDNQLWSVSNLSHAYFCLDDDALNPLGENYFRPALEIK